MRSFTKEYRLQGFSVREIAEVFERVTLELSGAHKFNGRKLKPGPLLNALVLAFLEMPPEERARATGASVARLEEFLAETDEERDAAKRRVAQAGSDVVAKTRLGVPPKDEGAAKKRRGVG